MGNCTSALASRTSIQRPRGVRSGLRSTSRLRLPLFAFGAALALVIVPMVDPSAAFEQASAATVEKLRAADDGQSFTVSAAGVSLDEVDRGKYKVIEKKVEPKKVVAAASEAIVTGTPDPGSAKDIALKLVEKKGWGYSEFNCLVSLWNKESGWNVYAHNVGSGAYGIAQALPGEKMASVASDWKTNAETQIIWGLGYIEGRYGTPCGAWASSEARGWY